MKFPVFPVLVFCGLALGFVGSQIAAKRVIEASNSQLLLDGCPAGRKLYSQSTMVGEAYYCDWMEGLNE
jgi:hypothetical protein